MFGRRLEEYRLPYREAGSRAATIVESSVEHQGYAAGSPDFYRAQAGK